MIEINDHGGLMRTRGTFILFAIASVLCMSGRVAAQTNQPADAVDLFAVAPIPAPPLLSPFEFDAPIVQEPAGPPPTPRHTGVKAMAKHLVTNFKYLPSKENLLWAGAGGGLALAVHPFDDDVNEALVGNATAEKIFKPGEILGQLGTLLGSASIVYAVGRIKDQPKVSHLGMDLIESLAMSEAVTQALKYATQRERPDHSDDHSFPSGHAADTFAFATALERHLNWRYSVPAYVFASYVAISRLPANRHWLSDAVFGATVGIIAGRTVTSHEAERPYPVAVVAVPGGMAIMYFHQSR
ncbi:MAG TPA: phosphatase PAP2 family protein [Vicinamibacterales bacterium]|jgi:membrane-associated phospholipid phosphatase